MDKLLFENSWLSVINRDNYIFTHTKNSVVYVLPYRRPKIEAYLLGRFEVCPAHNLQKKLCAITGQCEPGINPLQAITLELYEEAGFIAEPSQFVSLGSAYLTKQADTMAHFFVIDVTNISCATPSTDGSVFEQGSYCDWINLDEALSASCAGLQTLIARARL